MARMFEHFDHTADLGLRVQAPDLDTLFAEAARALLAAIVEDPATVTPAEERPIEIAGRDREYLLFDWLKKLLYLFDVEQMLFCRCDVHVGEDGLRATLAGEKLDRSRHDLCHEVKAITYHALKVEETDNGWLAEVI